MPALISRGIVSLWGLFTRALLGATRPARPATPRASGGSTWPRSTWGISQGSGRAAWGHLGDSRPNPAAVQVTLFLAPSRHLRALITDSIGRRTWQTCSGVSRARSSRRAQIPGCLPRCGGARRTRGPRPSPEPLMSPCASRRGSSASTTPKSNIGSAVLPGGENSFRTGGRLAV